MRFAGGKAHGLGPIGHVHPNIATVDADTFRAVVHLEIRARPLRGQLGVQPDIIRAARVFASAHGLGAA